MHPADGVLTVLNGLLMRHNPKWFGAGAKRQAPMRGLVYGFRCAQVITPPRPTVAMFESILHRSPGKEEREIVITMTARKPVTL
jgi:hypothetical protein